MLIRVTDRLRKTIYYYPIALQSVKQLSPARDWRQFTVLWHRPMSSDSVQASIPACGEAWRDEQASGRALRRAKRTATESGVTNAERTLEVGRSRQSILKSAEEHDIDRMRSHGRLGLLRAGSVTETVVR